MRNRTSQPKAKTSVRVFGGPWANQQIPRPVRDTLHVTVGKYQGFYSAEYQVGSLSWVSTI